MVDEEQPGLKLWARPNSTSSSAPILGTGFDVFTNSASYFSTSSGCNGDLRIDAEGGRNHLCIKLNNPAGNHDGIMHDYPVNKPVPTATVRDAGATFASTAAGLLVWSQSDALLRRAR